MAVQCNVKLNSLVEQVWWWLPVPTYHMLRHLGTRWVFISFAFVLLLELVTREDSQLAVQECGCRLAHVQLCSFKLLT